MGINGLLPFVKPATTKRHLSYYKGKTAAIDAFVWLHRGAIPDAKDLAFGRCNPEKCRYVPYVFKYVDMLISYGIKPILVFDGADLPSKEATEVGRREKKAKATREAIAMDRRSPGSKEAFKLFQQTIDVTFEMVQHVIVKARKRGVDYIVAPHEADIQIAWMVKHKFADFAVSEDSDLIVMGCPITIFKFKIDQNTVDEVATKDVYTNTVFQNEHMLKLAAITQGCDYIPSGVPRIGLKTIATWFSKNPGNEKLTLAQLFDKWDKLTPHKSELFELCENAMLTFNHQVVFNPKRLKREYFTKLNEKDLNGRNVKMFGTFHQEQEKQKEYNLMFALGNVNYKTNKLAKRQFNMQKLPAVFNRSMFDKVSASPVKNIKKVDNIPKSGLITPEMSSFNRISTKTSGTITPITKRTEKLSMTENSMTTKMKKRAKTFFAEDSIDDPLEPSQKKTKLDENDGSPKKLTPSQVLQEIGLGNVQKNSPKVSEINPEKTSKKSPENTNTPKINKLPDSPNSTQPKKANLTESEVVESELIDTSSSDDFELSDYAKLEQLAKAVEKNKKSNNNAKQQQKSTYNKKSFFMKKQQAARESSSQDSQDSQDEDMIIEVKRGATISGNYKSGTTSDLNFEEKENNVNKINRVVDVTDELESIDYQTTLKERRKNTKSSHVESGSVQLSSVKSKAGKSSCVKSSSVKPSSAKSSSAKSSSFITNFFKPMKK